MILMRMLPDPAYNEEPHIVVFQEAIGKQMTAFLAARDDMKRQARPATATWGMAFYERDWGLVVDESKPIDQRLAAWRARRRGVGTTNAQVIKSIAESFYNGEVDVVEHKKEFWFEMIFKSLIGIPPNMADLQFAIEEVKPAHMEAVYIVLWNTHDILRQLTHDELTQYTHDELRTVKFYPNTHDELKAHTHDGLAAYKHYQIMLEVLDNVNAYGLSQSGTACRF